MPAVPARRRLHLLLALLPASWATGPAHAQVATRLIEDEGRSWKLIEKLAADVAELVLSEFKPDAVKVEVKKFPIPQARQVSVRLTRQR